MGSKRLLSALSWTYTAGYFAYVIVVGIKTWRTVTWSAWWSDLALQAAWDAAFSHRFKDKSVAPIMVGSERRLREDNSPKNYWRVASPM